MSDMGFTAHQHKKAILRRSPGRSPGRAIVLLPASALAFAAALAKC